jgi:hypothetical protein
MTSDKYSRHVELVCPTCGGSQFEHGEDLGSDGASVRCIGCDRTMTKDELIASNAENIDEHIKEIGQEVVEDMQKRLNQAFKRSFRK